MSAAVTERDVHLDAVFGHIDGHLEAKLLDGQVAGTWRHEEDEIQLTPLRRLQPAERTTRFVVEEEEPTGDEEADFAEMLRRFKQGVAENVDAEDHQAHYDLGVAFKEMGLIDEAISEFQRAQMLANSPISHVDKITAPLFVAQGKNLGIFRRLGANDYGFYRVHLLQQYFCFLVRFDKE